MTALDDYLATIDPALHDTVRALDAAIRKGHKGFDVAIKYGILMYAVEGDWRYWVTAIDARPKAVSLRFLYGVLLEDPKAVLRKGSSVLMTWDVVPGEKVQSAAVASYVREAVGKHGYYKANSAEVIAQAKSRPARGRGTA